MFYLGKKQVGDSCFVIAELGSNHQGRFDIAARLVEEAAHAGADAVKFQCRDNRTLYTEAYYETPYNSENAYGPTYGTHREALELSEHALKDLRDLASELGIECFATAFDPPSVDKCQRLGFPAIKIASGDLTNTPLIRYASQVGVPLIVSTGAARIEDVDRAYENVHGDLALLQCTATYPSEAEDLDLWVIKTYTHRYPRAVPGFSSHHVSPSMSLAAACVGAKVIETHFTLSRASRGTDNAFSLERSGLRRLVRDIRRFEAAVGDGTKRMRADEFDAYQKMAKSCVATRDLPEGSFIHPEAVAFKSPGGGLPPYRADDLMGRRLLKAVKKDEIFELEDLV